MMRRVQHPFRVGGPAAASLLVNALLIAALLDLGMGRVNPRTDSPALTVMSLAVLKGVETGEEKAETATPATPSPATTPPTEAAPDQPQPPMAPVVMTPSPLAQAMPAATAPTALGPSAQASPTQTAAAGPSAPATPPPRRGVADGLDANAPAGTSRSYAAKVRSWLYAHKIYPRRARLRREEGRVQVRFIIDRAGLLIEGMILQRSGNAALDEEAIAMMRRASPFPKAPVEVRGDTIEFTAPIEFVLPV